MARRRSRGSGKRPSRTMARSAMRFQSPTIPLTSMPTTLVNTLISPLPPTQGVYTPVTTPATPLTPNGALRRLNSPCRARSQRRQVLFATNNAGLNGQTVRKLTPNSAIGCK